MVEPTGIEPVTSCLQGRCSTKIELRPHIFVFVCPKRQASFPLCQLLFCNRNLSNCVRGDTDGTRTRDLQSDSLVFYATELRCHIRGTGVIYLNLLFSIRLIQGKAPLANFTQPSLSGVLVLNLFISHRSCQPISKFYFASLYSVFRQPHIRASKWHCLTASLPVVVETYKIRVNAFRRSSRTALVRAKGLEPIRSPT